jgi:hypothetical protein
VTEVEALRLLLGIALGAALIAMLGWSRARSRIGRANRARAAVARTGEVAAEKLLARHGFVVVGRQVTGRWSLRIDGDEREVRCRADLVVRPKRDRHALYVAEVKTGGAVDPTLPSTRRQLLEYAMAFDVDGVLLLDMEERAVHRIEFPWIAR